MIGAGFMDIEKTVKLLTEAKRSYYNEGESIMTDAEYDRLEDALHKADPDNTFFKVVGAAPVLNTSGKIKHKVPMLSMHKAKSVVDVESWLKSIKGEHDTELIVEPKIDGLSASIVYEDNKLSYIATRGDGTEGQNITYIAPSIDIPRTITGYENLRVEIRGELCIFKTTKIHNPDNKPLRNIVAGLVNRKAVTPELKAVSFVAYGLAMDTDEIEAVLTTEESKLKTLNSLGFRVIDYATLNSIYALPFVYEQYLNEKRESWEYETDGLIIAINNCELHEKINKGRSLEHHNHYNIALKPPSVGVITTFKEIEWQVSRHGEVIPVAIFEPVNILGSSIQRASLSNAGIVNDLNLKVGDQIEVVKANDVIPQVTRNISAEEDGRESAPSLAPSVCPSCGKPLHLSLNKIHLNHDTDANKNACPDVIVKNITYWLRSCGVEGVNDPTIWTLYNDSKIKSITDLYTITSDALESSIGKVKGASLYKQIQSIKSMGIYKFVNALSIPSIGEKAVKKLGITSLSKLLNFSSDGSAIGEAVELFVGLNRDFIKLVCQYVTVTDAIPEKVGLRKVCMTGSGPKSRTELIKEIEAKGYEFSDTVNKETNILICEDVNGTSSKLQKARKMGIELISYTEFFK